jgi:hypothetical protein
MQFAFYCLNTKRKLKFLHFKHYKHSLKLYKMSKILKIKIKMKGKYRSERKIS